MRRIVSLFLCALLALCFPRASTALAQDFVGYTIRKGDPIAYSQSFGRNHSMIKLTDPEKVNRLSDMLDARTPLTARADVSNGGTIESYTISDGERDMSLYWDTLYNHTYLEEADVFYEVQLETGPFVSFMFELGDERANRVIPTAHRDLFGAYGWTLDYAIADLNLTLPKALHNSTDDEAATYFSYIDLFLKDAGYDIRPYLGQRAVASIYRIHEMIQWDRWDPQDRSGANVPISMRGIVLSQGNAIIGAYLSAGRHETTWSLSLDNKADHELLNGKTLPEYLTSIAKLTQKDTKIAALSPEEVLKLFCKTKKQSIATACFSRVELLERLSSNMEDDRLFLSWGSTFTMPKCGAKSVKEYDLTRNMYVVRLENGDQFYPDMVYEGERDGWRIAHFYNSGP